MRSLNRIMFSLLLPVLFTGACATKTVYIHHKPPVKTIEVKPTKPAYNYVWIEGHWQWSKIKGKYIWKKGHWEKQRKEKVWVSGHWKTTPRGWTWIRGYWK